MPTIPDPAVTAAYQAIGQFPHCDALILHAPKQCAYCDEHPDWQALRVLWGINFTGEHDPAKAPCPAERLRPMQIIDHWHNNRARPKDEPQDRFERLLKDDEKR